ncbi:MAG: AEC family transporter [Alphaproteobacteria bacterium]|nr:AEC family transporter [Alphaproteobacteria bacterium]
MFPILAALAPVFLLILFGYGLRRAGWFGAAFWADVDRLVFYILFPAFLVIRIGTADLSGLVLGPMGLGIAGGLFAMVALAFALKPLLRLDGPGFGAAFQGCMRPNIYVGFAAADALFGIEGGILAAIVVAVGTPLVNVFAAVVLTLYGPDGSGGWRHALMAMARNPVILAIAAGLAVNLSGLGLPPVLDDMLAILARGTLAMALLSVGAGLQFAAARQAGRTVLAVSALKLAGLPALTLAACLAFGAQGLPLAVAVMFASLPNSPTSYSMTRQLGGDHTMMAALITVQTFAAMATMPAVLVLIGWVAGTV